MATVTQVNVRHKDKVKVAAQKKYHNTTIGDRHLIEQRVLKVCAHPNIVRAYDLREGDVIMEWVHHGSIMELRQALGRPSIRNTHDVEFVRAVTLQVLVGLTYLHQVHKIIHRDVKPANVLVSDDGTVKMCDFDCCWLPPSISQGISGGEHGPIADTFTGTPGYQAPEQFDLAPHDDRVDVYALGKTVQELLGAQTGADGNLVLPTPLQGDQTAEAFAGLVRMMLVGVDERPKTVELLTSPVFGPCWGDVPTDAAEWRVLHDNNYCTDPRRPEFYVGWSTALHNAQNVRQQLLHCLKWVVTMSTAPAAATVRAWVHEAAN